MLSWGRRRGGGKPNGLLLQLKKTSEQRTGLLLVVTNFFVFLRFQKHTLLLRLYTYCSSQIRQNDKKQIIIFTGVGGHRYIHWYWFFGGIKQVHLAFGRAGGTEI